MECQSKDLLQPNIKKNKGQSRASIKWIDNLLIKKRESCAIPNINNNNFNNYNNNNKILYEKKELNIEEMIANAKIHRKANRPLKKIKEFDGNTKFCQCCYLPVKDNLSVKAFNFCENTDHYAVCGRGTSLYFSYFRFSTLILFFALILMALPSFLLTNNYTEQLINLCNKLYDIDKEKINETHPICLEFIDIKDISGFSMNDSEWVLKYNAINLRQYRELFHQLTNSYNNADKVILNYNISYFIGLVTLFIANIIYIILLFNINKQYDISVTSPSDYTIIITNLYSAFQIFWKKINRINLINSYIRGLNINVNNDKDVEIDVKENNDKGNNTKQELKEVKELGLERFPKGKEINILEGFNEFIKNTICESPDGEKFNIYRINICYKISEFMKIENEIQEKKSQIYKISHDPKQIEKNKQLELKDKKRKYFYYPFDAVGLTMLKFKSCEKFYELSDIESEKEKLESKLKELLKETENLTADNFSGVVFVTFDNIKEQEKFLEPFPKNLIMNIFVSIKNSKYFLCCCFIDKHKRKRFLLKRNIAVDKAPEPEDVIFENLQYSSLQRFFRMLIIYFISFIIIFICFVVILSLNYLQIKLQRGNSGNKKALKYTVSLLITLVISILNSVFKFFLDFLTKKEKQICMTNYYLSYSIKLTIFTFITSGVIPLISSYYYNSRVNFDLLVTNMFTIFLSNSFLTPIMWTMNFEYFFKKLKICLVENKCEHYTQKELNNLYEFLDMEIATKYSYITKTLLMSFLYMPIFPLSIFMSFIGFIFGYFIEKYNFANMYKRPEMLNSKICEFYSNYFIISFFMLCVGDYIFIQEINKSNGWPIANLILFAILMIIPYNQILAFDFIGINESELKKNQNYEEQYFTFYNDYEKINPMTKKEGIKHFLNKLTSNGLISKKDYDSILNNFENINLMETYYKARINFSNNLMQRVFLGMGDCATNNMSKRQSKFILNFKEFAKKNEGKLANNLFMNKNQDNNSESTCSGTNMHFLRKNSNDDIQNNIYKGNLNYLNNGLSLNYSNKNNKKNFQHSNFSLKSNSSESRLNENPEKKNTIDIFKNENNNNDKNNLANKKDKDKKPTGNIPSHEQKNILNLYSNPLFFGIKILINSTIQKNQDEEKNNIKDKDLINNIIEEQNEDKKDDVKIEIIENKEQKKENKNELNVNEDKDSKIDEENKSENIEKKEKEKEEDKKSEKNIDNDQKENEEKKENDENKNEEDKSKKKKKKRKKKKKKKHKKKKEEEEEKKKFEEEKKEEEKEKEEEKDEDKNKKEYKEESDKENEKEKEKEKEEDKEKEEKEDKKKEEEKEENKRKEKVEDKKEPKEEDSNSDEV